MVGARVICWLVRQGVPLNHPQGVQLFLVAGIHQRGATGCFQPSPALRESKGRSAAQADNHSVDDIWRFSKVCRVANVMSAYLESVE